MAYDKKKIAFWVIIVLALGVAVVLIKKYFFSSPECDPSHAGFDIKGNAVLKCVVKKPTTPAPSTAPRGWIPESFPLNVGMYGIKIKLLQQKLGIKDDGEFGDVQTKPAIIKAGYSVPLSEADYNKIVPPASQPQTPPSNSDIGKTAIAKSGITSIYINDSATAPSFDRFVPKDGIVGVVTGLSGNYYLLSGNLKVAQNEVYFA